MRSCWFTALQGRVCASTVRSPALYASTLRPLAEIRGRVLGPAPRLITSETQAATICIKPAQPESPPRVWGGRHYSREREFASLAEFLAEMSELCHGGLTRGDAVACVAFARDERAGDGAS